MPAFSPAVLPGSIPGAGDKGADTLRGRGTKRCLPPPTFYFPVDISRVQVYNSCMSKKKYRLPGHKPMGITLYLTDQDRAEIDGYYQKNPQLEKGYDVAKIILKAVRRRNRKEDSGQDE